MDVDNRYYKGGIITNAFLCTNKFVEHYEWLRAAAEKNNIEVELWQNDELLCSFGTYYEEKLRKRLSGYDFLIVWDKDIRLGRQITVLCDELDIPVFNSICAIDICDDKSKTYQKLWEWNRKKHLRDKIPLIKTITAPMTYQNIGFTNLDFLERVADELSFPIVVKECFGSFGMQVYMASDMDELKEIALRLGGIPHIYQEFVENSNGRDVRIQVVGDRVVAAMYRYSVDGDFRANITNGARMVKYEPNREECELALRTVRALGLDFAGVDILFSSRDKETADVVCEVNSNAHFKNIYECTGVNVAEEIISYIIEKIR